MIPISLIYLQKLTTLPEIPEKLSKKYKVPTTLFLTNEIAEKAYMNEGIYLKNDAYMSLPRKIYFGRDYNGSSEVCYQMTFYEWINQYKIKLL